MRRVPIIFMAMLLAAMHADRPLRGDDDNGDEQISRLFSAAQESLQPIEDRSSLGRLQRLVELSHWQTLAIALLPPGQADFNRVRQAAGAPALAERLAALPPTTAVPDKSPAPAWAEDVCGSLTKEKRRFQRLRDLDRLAELLQAESELTPAAAESLARYLLGDLVGHELREVFRRAGSLGHSRYLRLAVADQLQQSRLPDADLHEMVERLLMRRLKATPSEPLRRILHRRLLQSVLQELPADAQPAYDVGAAYQAAGQRLQKNYRRQAIMLGAAPGPLPDDEPGRVLAELVRWAVASWDADAEDAWEHRLQSLEAVSSNDLQRTVHLQRAWLELLQQSFPPPSAELQDVLAPSPGPMDLLDQLIDGESCLLRYWLQRLREHPEQS